MDIDVEWVEIPEGQCVVGVSHEQRTSIQRKLWDEYGLASMGDAERGAITSLAAKFRQRAHEIEDNGRSDILSSLTALERALLPHGVTDTRYGYFEAETVLELTPVQYIVQLPTFYITRYPITREHFSRFAISTGRLAAADKSDLPDMPQDLDFKTASELAAWAGARLPKPEEWLKAARGTDNRLYPWGDSWDAARGNFDYEYRPDYLKQRGSWRTPVNAYPGGSSPYDVWDLVGNLHEWLDGRPTLDQFGRVMSTVHGYKASAPRWFWSIIALTRRVSPDLKANYGARLVKDKLQ